MKYTGGCHCGNVKYEVELEIGRPIDCNCSICLKKGSLLSFAPVNKFRLVQGEDHLTDYQFNKRNIHHFFCSVCGISSFAKGTAPNGQEMRAINVRCLDGVNLDSLEVVKYDGRSK